MLNQNYKDAINFLDSPQRYGNHGDLNNISMVLSSLSNPQNSFKSIQVTGTNGKGSTSTFVHNLLIQKNIKVGLFTSPHIIRINERIKVSSKEISDDDLAKYILIVKDKMENLNLDLTYFEILTIVSFLYFKDKKVDIAVIEVGIGARIDPTNIVSNTILSIITTIGIDHKSRLGSTKEEVAYEKSFIIKNKSKVASFKHEKNVDDIFINKAKEKNSSIIFINRDEIKYQKLVDGFQVFYSDKKYHLKSLSKFQVYNSYLSLIALKEIGFSFEENECEKAFNIEIPARMNILNNKPLIIADGAHNEDAYKELLNFIESAKYDKIILCIGTMADKEYSESLKQIIDMSSKVIISRIDYDRALNMDKIKEIYNIKNYEIKNNLNEAYTRAFELSNCSTLTVFTGSLYFIGEILKLHQKN